MLYYYFYRPTGSPPTAPSGLTASIVSSTAINLSWTDNSATETSFRIERSTDNISFLEIGSAATDATTYSDTGLTAGTLYYYRVKARKNTDDSGYSNTASATTYRADVQAYFTAGSITDATEILAVNTLILGLVSANLLSKFDRLWLFSPTSQAACLLDFISLISMTDVAAGTYSASGYLSDGATQSLNTNFIPSSNAVNMTNTSASFGIYASGSIASGTRTYGGATTGTKQILLRGASSSGNIIFRGSMYDSTASTFASYTENTTTEYTSFRVVSRTSATVVTEYDSGTAISATSVSSSATVAQNNLALFIGAENNGGVAANFAGLTYKFGFLASGLSQSEVITLDNLQTAYQQTLNRYTYRTVASTFFTNASITNLSEKAYMNRAIAGFKAGNIWGSMNQILLRSPTSFSASLYDAKSNSQQTAVNMSAANWSASNGMIYDGLTMYARCTRSPSTAGMTTGSGFIAVYVKNNSATASTLAGCLHSDGANQVAINYDGSVS